MIKIAWALSENSCDIININMELIETCIPGVVIVQPRIFGDERGYFFESFRSVISNGRYVKPFLSRIMSRSRVTVW